VHANRVNPPRGLMKMRTLLAVLVAGAMLAGCASQNGRTSGPVFFPPSPDLPRFQFLMGINDSRDVEGRKSSLSLFSLGEAEEQKVQYLLKPYGIAAKGDVVYVCDTKTAQVSVMDFGRKKVTQLKGNYGPGKLKKPVNLSTDREGNLYVADVDRKEVVMFNPEGEFVMAFGKGLEMKPVDVGVDGDLLYVLDFNHSDIKIIDRQTGKLLRTAGQASDNSSDNLSLPTNMTLDARGFVYSTNTTTGKVIKLDRDGHVISSFGKLGDGFGQFGRPKGIAVDDENRIYVVDAAHQNIQVFSESGQLLMFFGDPGLPAGSLNIPAGVAISRDNLEHFQKLADPSFQVEQLVFVTNQSGNPKISIYGMGHKKGADYEKALQETLKERQEQLEQLKKKEDKGGDQK